MKALAYVLILAAVAAAPLLAAANGRHHSCHQCGCSNLKKVCRLVPEIKKVPKVVYDYECEDFCVPGPSKMCGTKCVPDCEAHHGYRKEIIWQPCCGKVHTRKKLVKKTIIEEKPGFKCVVDVICCGCGCNCGQEDCVDEGPAANQQAMLDAR